MNTTTRRTRRLLIGGSLTALALTGSALSLAGVANACVPNYPAMISMTITNNSDQTLYLHGSDNPYGDWVVAPQQTLAPHSTETVSASTWNSGGFGVDVTYGISGTSDEAVFFANNYGGDTNTDATRIDGANTNHLGISSNVETGAPYMDASYTIMPLLY